MSWLPISGTLPQYSTSDNALAGDYYLKFYASGTSTPINMATDSTGGTTLAKCALSDDGYPISNPLDSSTRFIPHIDQDYRIVLYTNETDADNNTTGSAAFNIDGMVLQVVPTGDAANITLRDVTIEQQDDYDRSPLFVNGDGFAAGAGPHVITVPSNWTPTNADMRFYLLSESGIVTALTPSSTSATTFTLAETLLSTDVVFLGDDTFRSFADAVGNLLQGYTVGWATQVAEYNGATLTTTLQDSAPNAITFNTNGTKVFVAGDTNNTVYAYDLTTSYDLSTASYNSESFSVASQDTFPRGIEFNLDGTKMFVLGQGNDTVFAYDLSTAFNVSTAVYNSESFSVTSQDTAPLSLKFKPDGTKMFITGATNDKIFAYDLGTAFDLSTASYNSENFSVSAQDTSPSAVAFNADGTKMLFLGDANNSIFTYSLSTAFDVSTAVYTNINFSVAAQDATPNDVVFSPDGTKMFVTGAVSKTIYTYLTSFIRA